MDEYLDTKVIEISIINKDVPRDTLTLARAKQVSLSDWKGPNSEKKS